ncbi:hypothetical protein KM043_009887 [Ampulex compressa]|nr:hypothetical protein KM043_009887 [Ampulex compressa]
MAALSVLSCVAYAHPAVSLAHTKKWVKDERSIFPDVVAARPSNQEGCAAAPIHACRPIGWCINSAVPSVIGAGRYRRSERTRDCHRGGRPCQDPAAPRSSREFFGEELSCLPMPAVSAPRHRLGVAHNYHDDDTPRRRKRADLNVYSAHG